MTTVLIWFTTANAVVTKRKMKSDAAFFIFIPTRGLPSELVVFLEADETIARACSAGDLDIQRSCDDYIINHVRRIGGRIDECSAKNAYPCCASIIADLNDTACCAGSVLLREISNDHELIAVDSWKTLRVASCDYFAFEIIAECDAGKI